MKKVSKNGIFMEFQKRDWTVQKSAISEINEIIPGYMVRRG